MEKGNESTQKLDYIMTESNSETETPQLAIENTPTHQPKENNEVVLYDVEWENTLKNVENDNTGLLKTYLDPQHGWLLNNYPTEMLRGSEVEVNGKEDKIIPGIQKVFVNSTYDVAKSMNDTEKFFLEISYGK